MSEAATPFSPALFVYDGRAGHSDFSRGGVCFAEIEGSLIVEALRAARGNRRRPTELLDISQETLRYRTEKHRL